MPVAFTILIVAIYVICVLFILWEVNHAAKIDKF